MCIDFLENLAISSANLPDFSLENNVGACTDCCCDLGCETYT